jgi:hypothetical protein
MTLFWLWVSVGCAVSALIGFSTVRLGARKLGTDAWPPEPSALPPERAPEVVATASPLLERPVPPAVTRTRPVTAKQTTARQTPRKRARPKTAQPELAEPAPIPTAPRPDAEKLALWARQVKAGERRMSVATDGCRVTWNRTCKHGHPSWLVHLGYVRRHYLPRNNPR